jgi:hypothetical protein
MSSNLSSETKLRDFFLASFESEVDRFYCEVPVFCRSVDVVKYDSRTGSITAIEFKRDNWKRAIKQALSVSISFDYLEICIPMPKTEKTRAYIVDECTENGVGLYFYDESYVSTEEAFQKAVEPLRVLDAWQVQKTRVVQYVGGLSDG